MTITAGNKADFELPGDLGEHDPRRMDHPIGNEPGAGGHEVKPNSKEVLGENHNSEATAAHRDHDRHHPGKDNTAEQALEGGSAETMDRAKRQAGSDSEGLSRAGHQQQSTMHEGHHGHGHDHSHTHGQGQGYDGASSIRGPGQEGNFVRDQESRHQPTGDLHGHHQNEGVSGLGGSGAGLTGGRDNYQSGSEPLSGHHHQHEGRGGLTGSGAGLTGSGSGLTGGRDNYQSGSEPLSGHHQHEGRGGLTGSGSGLTGGRDNYQSGTEPLSGHRGAGVAGEPYDAGNIQESGLGGSAPQHSSTFGSHNTRAGELLDPSSGKETGIPGYAAGSRQ